MRLDALVQGIRHVAGPAAISAWCFLQVRLQFREDSLLARRLKERDPHAMGILYDRYGRLAYSVIFHMVRNSAAAEDLVQETFLRIWNRAQSFDPSCGGLGPWIATVARNRAIDYVRSVSGRMSAGSVELDLLERPALYAGFDESALSLERARQLKAAFETLAPNQKTVLELAYFEGLSLAEMAARMEQPAMIVSSWMRDALRILREELAKGAATA